MTNEELNRKIMQSEDYWDRLKDKVIDQEITIKNLNDDATRLLEISKQDKEELELKSKVIRDLLKRISNLEYEVEDKERVIDKAIEHIEELGTQDGILKDYRIDKYIKEDLLNILRGDKE